MKSEVTGQYKNVRGLTRGLDLLYLLNRAHGGAKIRDLAQWSGIHRTTVHRILETLASEGYVRRSPSDDSYQLTIKVRQLSDGFQDAQWISQLAAPLLGKLLQEVIWPTDICTLDGDAMVIRETTHRFSKLSFHRDMVGRRLPLLMTATGRAYITYCPEAERNDILEQLRQQDDRQGELANDEDYVRRVLRQTREQGYGANNQDWGDEGNIAAIARPIMRQDEVVGCLNLVYIAKAMTTEKAAKKYLKKMNDVVLKIEEQL
ncbi:DNA-binding transcriptional regulator [uncultured Amphritea sp.]|uniref:DNA-binding transcriptional regulator n=1 Tax=Amphritea sp. TaxID=1872502 RepID=UPI001D4C69E2|nr:DNA-binding transcriptional regulator [uncultured Amphritea sp.]MBR9867405.1 DNA-binding transcriptional activator MhpR [Oceanospirillales bacterium]MBR9888549.1 DNA-binding transcriptional activator MhpR [Oceanospirillales bacterium]